MIYKQKYRYKYIFEWHDKYNAWLCTGGTDMLVIGSEVQNVLKELIPDYKTEIFNVINMHTFRNINFSKLRIYKTNHQIIIEYERRDVQ